MRCRDMTCLEMAQELGLDWSNADECIRRRMVRLGIPRLPKKPRPGKSRHWKGGRLIDKQGYVLLLMKGHPMANHAGYVREHRLVMSQVLGRSLSPDEVVHHIDGNPQNNRPDNLRLFGANGEHLASELKGRSPNISEAGRARIRQAVRASNRRRAASRSESAEGGRGKS